MDTQSSYGIAMSTELGAALVGLVFALTALVKQITDKTRNDRSSEAKESKDKERFAVLENRVKTLEDNRNSADRRFDKMEEELKTISSKLNELMGMWKATFGKDLKI